MDDVSEPVGMVLGTEDATPLTFWVGVANDAYLQLDDAVVVDAEVPGRGSLRIAGIVQDVRARHEGASFDTDVFLVDRGVLPVDTAVAAQVVATRFEPEISCPRFRGLPPLRRGKVATIPVIDSDDAAIVVGSRRREPSSRPRLPGGSRGRTSTSRHLGVATDNVRAVPPYALFTPTRSGYTAPTQDRVT